MTDIGNKLTVFCSPVSGGRFVNQIACMQELFKARLIKNGGKCLGKDDYQPDIMLGSSGGNISNYIALSADFNEHGLTRIVSKIETPMFIRDWITKYFSFFPSWPVGILTGNMYDQGKKGKPFLKSLLDKSTIKRVEMWTGTYDESNKKSKFFCNKAFGDTLIDPKFFDNEKHKNGVLPLEFLDGNIDELVSIIIASGSIPFIVSGQNIGGVIHSDGGCCFPSPISVFSDEICRLVMNNDNKSDKNIIVTETGNIIEENSADNEIVFQLNGNGYELYKEESKIRPLRLYYFCPYQIDESTPPEKNVKSFELLKQIVSQLMNSNMINDINAAKGIIKRISDGRKIVTEVYDDMNTQKLAELLVVMESKLHYFMIFSPYGNPKVDLYDLDGDKILDVIRKTRDNYKVEVCYVG